MSMIGTIIAPELPDSLPENAQWLLGQGAGTWFSIAATDERTEFNIKRFSADGSLDCDRMFQVEYNGSIFDINQAYQFGHVSHCTKCRIAQHGNIFIFNYIEE